MLGLVALAFALYAIFNGGSTQPDVPTGIRATAVGLLYGHERVGAAIGSFATLWALSNLGISGTMWIAAGIAGVGCGELHGTRNSGQEPVRGRLAVS